MHGASQTEHLGVIMARVNRAAMRPILDTSALMRHEAAKRRRAARRAQMLAEKRARREARV